MFRDIINKASPSWAVVAVVLLSIMSASIAEPVTEKPQPTKIIKESPIVINTVAKHYQNPTLTEFHLCTKARDQCLDKCSQSDSKCRDACPVCPILIDQAILVQGINDSIYSLPDLSNKINQTNIIRLTNEIRNIIETRLGNITTNSQNNINITSKTGGKFGLGYDEKGPCCHVLNPRRCRRSINGPICQQPRHQRSCGSHCISRVMRSKRMVLCNETNPNDCTQETVYLPEPRRPGCHYTSEFPFISCGTQGRIASRRPNCARCYQIPYVQVMRGQIPNECRSCFSRQRPPIYQLPVARNYVNYGGYPPMYPIYPNYPQYQPYYPPQGGNNFDNNEWSIGVPELNEFETPTFSFSDGGWQVEEQKCVKDDGTIDENCKANSNNDTALTSTQLKNQIIDEDYDVADGLDYDYGEFGAGHAATAMRVRRHGSNFF